MSSDKAEEASRQALRAQADRRQLQQIIVGLSEGVILVDPAGEILWANEAALKMHGLDQVEELGGNAAGYRKRFKLRYRNRHPIRPGHYPIDRVLAGEVFSDVVVEVTPAADPDTRWVHRMRSLVLTDAEDRPDCLVLILADATDWASAEQRFEKTFNANPAPAAICRLSDLRYIKVNQGFLEMTGYAREDVIEHSVYEVDVLERAERRELAIEHLGQGITIPQMEAELRLPGGGDKLVIVAGQPLEVGEEACMLFSFTDLEPRRKAEDAMRQSEERFAKAFRMTPIPTLVCSADGFRILELNDALAAATGYAAEDMLGRSIMELGLFEGERSRKEIAAALEQAGRLHGAEYRVRRQDGETLDCVVSAETASIHGQPCYLMALQDITERKRNELELMTAIETVMQDASWFSQTLIEKLANVKHAGTPGAGQGTLGDLTPRERDTLGLMCEGLADKSIAARLGVSPNTVRNHVATLYAKLGVHSRSAAIVWARERGFSGKAARPATGERNRRAR